MPGLRVAAPPSTLVGRREERAWLLERLAAAQGGEPSAVVIRGEPGIGKSRLAREIVRVALEQGGTASIGRCLPALDVPYLPFVDDLFVRLGETGTDPTAAWRALAAIVRRSPFVLFVDDVQWADQSSMDLLRAIVCGASDLALTGPVRLLVLLAVRDTPDAAVPPELDTIRREAITSTLTLEGLAELDVSRLVSELGVTGAPKTWVSDLTRATRGNPLFVMGVVKEFLSAHGHRDDTWPRRIESALASDRLPSEITEVIGQRIAALSGGCREALTSAALLGGQWELSRLSAVTEQDPAALAEVLDEAVTTGIVERVDRMFEFSHPLYAEAFQAHLGAGARQRVHLRIAQSLQEQAASDSSVSVMEIAYHLRAAGPLAPAPDVLRYAATAADRAASVFAWSDAARYFEAALGAAVTLGDTDAEARLAHRAGRARLHGGEPAEAMPHFDRCITLVDAASDPAAAAEVWADRLQCATFLALPGRPPDAGPLPSLLPGLEASDPTIAVLVLSRLAQAAWSQLRLEEARTHAERAIELGRRTGAAAELTEAHRSVAMVHWIRLELGAALDQLHEAHACALASGDAHRQVTATMPLTLNLAWLGRFDEAQRAIDDAERLGRQLDIPTQLGLVLLAKATIHLARGMYAEVEADGRDAIEIQRVTNYSWVRSLVYPTLAMARLRQGDWVGAESVIEEWEFDPSRPPIATTAWLLGLIARHEGGDWDAIGAELDRRAITAEPAWHAISGDGAAALVIEVAARTGRAGLAQAIAPVLERAYANGQRFTTSMAMLIPRVLGVAAGVAGDLPGARRWFDEAITLAEQLEAHAELTLSELAYAGFLAMDHTDLATARAYCERARWRARTLGMAAVQADAELLASRLAGADVPAEDTAERDRVVILMTDVADSTHLAETLGDWVYHQRQRVLDRRVRDAIAARGGRAVDGVTLGDGVLAEFATVDAALACADDCRRCGDEAGLPLHIGVHTGDVIRLAGNIFGGAVNLASRVCGVAATGEVLVSHAVLEQADRGAFRFEDRGDHRLKGISGPVRLHTLKGE